MEYMELGPVPYDEDCAQVGAADYHSRMKREAKAFIGQLNRLFPESERPKGVNFINKSFPHDFGTYHEVCVTWNDRQGMEYALRVESNMPAEWDAEAKAELSATVAG